MKPRKSASKNLENKKSMFFQVGLVIALVLVFYAFQWKVYERTNPTWEQVGELFTEEEHMVVTLPPPPPPPLPPPPEFEIVVVPNEEDIVDYIPTDNTGADENTRIAPMFIPEYVDPPVDENIIFDFVDAMPEFPGGQTALYRYLSRHMRYPSAAVTANVQGTVVVAFVVERDGSITQVHIAKGVSKELDEEAMRVIKGMPLWTPGRMGVNKVRVKFMLPVNFRLERGR